MPETPAASETPVESPPPSPTPPRETAAADPALALHRLAEELMRTQNRRMLIEFLQLRRALR